MWREKWKHLSFDVYRILAVTDKRQAYRHVRAKTEDRIRCAVGFDPFDVQRSPLRMLRRDQLPNKRVIDVWLVGVELGHLGC